ncbi:GNAT family N-acetyltransferase [Rickettsia endosymbiont of Halotydeus destructor]|uniref:GNAT family N-acetyltransferase n=1 Tax=Rickettsia endosymbiont of Halotydeus destructor TaxID=2996754 RepID=UPI003BAE8AF9
MCDISLAYKSIRLTYCAHFNEWEEYHRIRKEQIFDPINVEYNSNHPTINADNHYHFILYKGLQIVATAHIEFLNENEAALRSLATDKPYQNQGFGTNMMQLLEKWLKNQNIKALKMHARVSAEIFYRKLKYINMEFDDISIQKNYVDLGKML